MKKKIIINIEDAINWLYGIDDGSVNANFLELHIEVEE